MYQCVHAYNYTILQSANSRDVFSSTQVHTNTLVVIDHLQGACQADSYFFVKSSFLHFHWHALYKLSPNGFDADLHTLITQVYGAAYSTCTCTYIDVTEAIMHA